MSEFEYKQLGGEAVDAESSQVVTATTDYLTQHLGNGVAVLFASTTGIQVTKTGHDESFGHEARRTKQAVIDLLSHFALQLKQIIKDYK